MPEGTGINHKAKLTIEKVFPKTPMDNNKFISMLKRKAEKLNAEYVDYNATTGEWILRIQHA